MYVDISVTPMDIRMGLRNNSKKCPIKRALQRKFVNSEVLVYSEEFRIDWLTCKLTKKAKEFIRRFDSGKPVKPGVFRFFVK